MRLIRRPVLCNYYVTYRCNARCGFCDIWERPSPYITMSHVERNLSDLKKLGVKVVDFTGGEPLLHREIDALLRLAREMGFITTLTTNAMLYPKWAERLKGLVDMLHFSLDAADEAKHDASRGVISFELVMQSIVMAKSMGERPDILFTATEETMGEIPMVYDLCRNHGLMLILNPVFDYNTIDSGGGLSLHSLQKLSVWGRNKGVYLNEAFIQLRKDGGNHIADPICRAASASIVISPDNKLLLPCYHLGIKALDINDRLYQLYTSPKVKKLIAMEGKYPQCEGCSINCYMQPSFAVEVNRYWWKALPSTLKYNLAKGTWKRLVRIKKQ